MTLPVKGHSPQSAATGFAIETNSSLPQWSFGGQHCITPEEATEPFCVYSSHAFADGRGISILTTPSRIASISQLPAFIESSAFMDGNGARVSPPFEERELPGRGRGLIANRTMFRGDRILAHTPLLMLDTEAYEDLDDTEWIELETAAVDQLPAESRAAFWKLYGQPTTHPVSDRINTNAFEIETAAGTYYGVFPEIARLNHDCRPNAAYFFDPETFTHFVHATTTVSPGTELTITYIDPHLPHSQRRRQLSASWGFECSCSLCSAHPSMREASDARLRQIERLTEVLTDDLSSPGEMARSLISLYEQERLHAAVSSAYRLAARAFCAEGRHWETVSHAWRATELTLLDDGFHDDQRPFAFDLLQLLRFLVLTLLTAPPNYVWQQFLEKRFPAYPVDSRPERQRDVELKALEEAHRDRERQQARSGPDATTPKFSLRNTFAKWIIDCITVGAVANTVAFLLIMGLLKYQSWAQIWHNIRTQETMPIIVAGYKIWPVASIISFTFVPVQRRIVFLSFVGLIWGIYMSLVAARV
ncbi:SET domain-containingprotein [Purpureocillium lavendulum]|uniref:SET domain-containingprotein n=1 Tax=Purpureocillium lavendulum TaxID=1247861 RepID=A0AB34G173_9HYPO|nr:SET domain-containingprotein [Purpureocillium lavendulum]